MNYEKSVCLFMSWLDCFIEEIKVDESINPFDLPSHEYHNYMGMLRALKEVESKAKELGWKVPKRLGDCEPKK